MSTAPGPEPQDAPQDILDTPHAAQAVVRGGFWRMASFFSSNALAVLSATVIVRYLGVVDLGRYTTVVALTTLISGLFEAGLGTLGIREASILHGAERDRFLRNLLGLRLVVATVGALISVAAAAALGYPSLIVLGTAVASCGVFAYTLQTHYATMLQVDLRLAQFSLLDFVRQVAFTVFAILFVVLNLGLVAMLAVPLPSHLVVLALTLYFAAGAMPFGVSFAFGEWRDLLSKSVPIAMTTGVGVVYAYVAVLLLSLVTNDVQTGTFSASFRIFGVVAGVPGLLVASVLPIISRAARDDRERLNAAIQRTFEVSVTVGSGLALLTVVGAPVAIAIIGGAAFDQSVPVLQIQAIALICTAAIAALAFGLLGIGAFRSVLICNLLGVASIVLLTLALAGPLGAQGGALASVGGELVLSACFVYAAHRSGVALRWRIPTLSVLAALPLAVAALLVDLPPLAEVFVAGALFVAALFALRIFPKELLRSFRRTGDASR